MKTAIIVLVAIMFIGCGKESEIVSSGMKGGAPYAISQTDTRVLDQIDRTYRATVKMEPGDTVLFDYGNVGLDVFVGIEVEGTGLLEVILNREDEGLNCQRWIMDGGQVRDFKIINIGQGAITLNATIK